MTPPYKVLSEEQVSFFMENGYVLIPQAFTRKQAEELASSVWPRLGYLPEDKSTWLSDRVNMPWHRRFPVESISPKAWNAICDLLGGEGRVDERSTSWGDSFICNFGSQKWDEQWQDYKDGREGVAHPNDGKLLDGWHVDGDFFVHFLDSKEQALLVIPLFTDVVHDGGATMICPEGIGRLALWLMDHPDGVLPRMKPVESLEDDARNDFSTLSWYQQTIEQCSDFRQMTGKAGDVILMHPFMLHSASRNLLRTHRIITNPPVSLKEPFNYDLPNPDDYSLVERKTLLELGKALKAQGRIADEKEVRGGLKDWKVTGVRRLIVPERVKIQQEMKTREEARLRGEQIEANRDPGIIDDAAKTSRKPGVATV